MEIIKKGIAIKAFFKRPQKNGHILLCCYIGIYTIFQLHLVDARHHELGNLVNNNNFNDNQVNNLPLQQSHQHQQQQNVNAQIIHNNLKQQQPPPLQQQTTLLKQQPILGQKVTQSAPIVEGGAVLAKDDGKYFLLMIIKNQKCTHKCVFLIFCVIRLTQILHKALWETI